MIFFAFFILITNDLSIVVVEFSWRHEIELVRSLMEFEIMAALKIILRSAALREYRET